MTGPRLRSRGATAEIERVAALRRVSDERNAAQERWTSTRRPWSDHRTLRWEWRDRPPRHVGDVPDERRDLPGWVLLRLRRQRTGWWSLAGLDDEVRDALVNQIDRLDLLRDERTHLPFPHGSEIDPKLRERCCNYGRQLQCVWYRRYDRLIVLLHGSPSAPPRIPAGDIRVTQQRRDDFKRRLDVRRARARQIRDGVKAASHAVTTKGSSDQRPGSSAGEVQGGGWAERRGAPCGW